MKSIIFFLLHICFIGLSFGQKAVLDTSTFDQWSSVKWSSVALSNNGNYVIYNVGNSRGSNDTLHIQAIDHSWKHEIADVKVHWITDDEKRVIALDRKNFLHILKIGTKIVETIPNVSSAKLFSCNNKEWLLYLKGNNLHELILRQIKTNEEYVYSNVASYQISSKSNTLILLKKENDRQKISWLDISSLREKATGNFEQIENIVIDQAGEKIAFIAENDRIVGKGKAIWYYTKESDQPLMLSFCKSHSIDSGLIISNLQRFSSDGNRIFVNLKELPRAKPQGNAIMVDVWSYMDCRSQSIQLKELGNKTFLGVIDVQNKRVIRLQRENEIFNFLSEKNDDLASIVFRKGNLSERSWNSTAKSHYFILNTKTGDRKEIDVLAISISPDYRFILGYDSTLTDLCSYELKTGRISSLTKDLPIVAESPDNYRADKRRMITFAGWGKERGTLLVYDDYDIWEINIFNHFDFTNLTNGYGRKNNLVFRIANEKKDNSYIINDIKLLNAFNISTKENGFYKVSSAKKTNPLELTMGAYFYSQPDYLNMGRYYPIKAKNKKIWIVNREEASTSPNLFVTSDFRNFDPISNVHPEDKFNWLTTELITYASLNGKQTQGILYKPENFDPQKKYPVIMHYYERKTDAKNCYHRPQASGGEINIPWFVSNEYLVFTPDIHYSVGAPGPGKSACNSVIAAAKYLAKMPWVNSKKIGLNGHSFGGYETNFIISQTDLFAAAVASCGLSDLVSAYGEITYGSGDAFLQQWAEQGQGRIGATLWQEPELYIQNSPVFFADKVNTPLLMMNNKEDGVVNFSQGIEYFTALRRLRKRVWMLQYDGEGHGVSGKNAEDFNMRITQFFDHYLKDIPAPRWMTHGIAAEQKGIDNGY